MIWIDEENKIVHVPENVSLDTLASFLEEVFPFEEHDYKIMIDGINEETDIEG